MTIMVIMTMITLTITMIILTSKCQVYLLRWDLIGGRSHVNLLIDINAWDDEEDTFE